jgi:transposase InsO family protein
MWETDITKIYIDHEGWIYFTAYVDLFSRKIKGYLVSRMSRQRAANLNCGLMGQDQDLLPSDSHATSSCSVFLRAFFIDI